MNIKKHYPKTKKNSSRNLILKFFLIIVFISASFIIFTELKHFTAPYIADSKSEEITALIQKGLQNDSGETEKSGKNSRHEIDFTFFDTLTKTEKYTSSNELENRTPEEYLREKEEKNSKPESSQSIENEELEAPQSVINSKFFLQMGSFKDKSRAEAFIAMLNKKGYQASIESAEVSNKGLWYRVYLKQKFVDRESALRLIREIKHQDNISALLMTRSSSQ